MASSKIVEALDRILAKLDKLSPEQLLELLEKSKVCPDSASKYALLERMILTGDRDEKGTRRPD